MCNQDFRRIFQNDPFRETGRKARFLSWHRSGSIRICRSYILKFNQATFSKSNHVYLHRKILNLLLPAGHLDGGEAQSSDLQGSHGELYDWCVHANKKQVMRMCRISMTLRFLFKSEQLAWKLFSRTTTFKKLHMEIWDQDFEHQ